MSRWLLFLVVCFIVWTGGFTAGFYVGAFSSVGARFKAWNTGCPITYLNCHGDPL